MAGRQAKVISARALDAVLKNVARQPNARRNRVIVLLSVRAGLRAAEIAKLEWSMVLDASGNVAHAIELPDDVAKKGAGRHLPLHRDLRRALVCLSTESAGDGPVIRSARGGAMKPNSIVNWFISLYRELGLEGCSSHSGRRTFITHVARLTYRVGGSLRDVQVLAGHRSIETTQRYIDGDTPTQRRLVSLL
jgi:integrase